LHAHAKDAETFPAERNRYGFFGEGGFDGVLSVEHEDPVWVGTPELIEAGLRIARNNLRGLVVR
jgi:hypothetical protein